MPLVGKTWERDWYLKKNSLQNEFIERYQYNDTVEFLNTTSARTPDEDGNYVFAMLNKAVLYDNPEARSHVWPNVYFKDLSESNVVDAVRLPYFQFGF